MNKIIIFFIVSILFSSVSFGQNFNDKMIFVVDSIPVVNDPEEGNEILQTDIADMKIIRDKDSLKNMVMNNIME